MVLLDHTGFKFQLVDRFFLNKELSSKNPRFQLLLKNPRICKHIHTMKLSYSWPLEAVYVLLVSPLAPPNSAVAKLRQSSSVH